MNFYTNAKIILFLGFRKSHLAVTAVEMKDEPLSVVEQVQWSSVPASVMFRAHSELISDAVFCPHQLGFAGMTQLIRRFSGFCSAREINGFR